MDRVGEEYWGDDTTENPSNVVPLTVAAYTNREIVDLPPLYYSIDPDALDAVVNSMEGGHITFDYAGHMVTVNASGEVSIESLDE